MEVGKGDCKVGLRGSKPHLVGESSNGQELLRFSIKVNKALIGRSRIVNMIFVLRKLWLNIMVGIVY